MPHTFINPDGLASLPGASHAVIAKAGRTVYVSGQTGVDAEGKLVSPDHRGQAEQALRNLTTVLSASGARADDIVRLGIYIVDYDETAYAALVDAAVAVFGQELPAPASTLVGVDRLWQPDVLIEIDAVAVVVALPSIATPNLAFSARAAPAWWAGRHPMNSPRLG